MTLCPIAMIVGCRKCPVLTICPLKSIIGDFKKPEKNQGGKEQKEESENKAP